jgi:hypothetical protein
MIHMPLKWHHIDKCNKNCWKINILESILAHLNPSTPKISFYEFFFGQKYYNPLKQDKHIGSLIHDFTQEWKDQCNPTKRLIHKIINHNPKNYAMKTDS